MRFQTYGFLFSAKHPEGSGCQLSRIIILKKFPAAAGRLFKPDLHNLVHPVVLHSATLLITGDQIIILILPHKSPGTDTVPFSILLQPQLLLHCPFAVLKRNLLILGKCSLNLINTVIHTLIHSPHTVLHKNLATQLSGLMDTRKALQLPDQLAGLPTGNKSGRLYRIYQKFQFRKLKFPAGQIKTCRLFSAVENVHSKIP